MPVKFAKRTDIVLNEPDLLYHPEFLKIYAGDVTLDGYWQCSKYWSGIEDQIRTSLTLRNQPSDKTLAVAKKIKESKNSTFLHVRRSDNLSCRGLAFHNVSPIAYYEKAIAFISEQVGELSLFVFSDDIEWCKNCLPFPATFVDHNNPGVDWDAEYSLKRNNKGGEHEDLWLMSLCENAITATSTFSWFGAYLWNMRDGPKNHIVAPRQWFVQVNEQSRDMIPESWVRL